MAKWVIALLVLVFVVALPTPAPVAQDYGIAIRKPFAEMGSALRRFRRFLRQQAPRLPQYYYDNRGGRSVARRPLARGDVVTTLQKEGFKDISIVQQRGTTYICEATGTGGERVRLVVNGLTGGIDGVRLLGPRRPRF